MFDNNETPNQTKTNNIPQQNNKFVEFWNKPIGKVVIIGTPLVLLIALISIIYWFSNTYKYFDDISENDVDNFEFEIKPSEETAKPRITTIDQFNPVEFIQKSAGYCKALTPKDWIITSDESGRGVDLYNPEKTQGAGWFIAPILYGWGGEPENAVKLMMEALGNENFTFSQDAKTVDGGFIMRDFSSTTEGKNIKGIALYKKYPVDDYGYILSYYTGFTTVDSWEKNGAIPSAVAISIRCQAQITPSPDDGFSSTSNSVSDSSDKKDLSEKWSEAILGYETVHSPSTGQTYQVSTNAYSKTGMQGQDPGYYRSIGTVGEVERLEPGYGSY